MIASALIGRALAVVLAGLTMVQPAFADPPQGAGMLLSKARMEGAPDAATAWRIRYRSFAENGAPVEISGVVVVPSGPAPAGGRDIVSWGHGTVGIAGHCAPSATPALFKDIAGLDAMLQRGEIVAATDFQGLGTPGPMPYLVGVSSGRAMLDAVRAARQVPGADAGSRYALWGESEGAHAALWAAQLAPDYAPKLDLVGVAAAAPPTDIDAGFYALTNPAVRALITGYTSDAWSQVYGIPLSTFADGIGRFLIRRLAGSCLHLDSAATLANVTLLLASHQLPEHLGQPWTPEIRANSVEPIRLHVPMLIAQGGRDDVVLTNVTQAFLKKSCTAGNTIRYLAIASASHSTIAAMSAPAVVPWLADRFAGKPAPDDCAGIEASIGAAGGPTPAATATERKS